MGRLLQWFGKLLPSCFNALRLAEKGREAPLSLREKALLTYNSGLCLHCNCARRKFDKAKAEMRQAEAERAGE
ncbi:MAG: hypothetical protein ACFE0O_02705 [Opitutales bacterium]